MKDYISKAFKSLDEEFSIKVDEPVYLKEEEEFHTILDLLKKDLSYNVIHDFDIDGEPFSLYVEATCDGESCDAIFGEFDVENIDGVIVDVLDSERNFKGNIHEIDKDTSVDDAIEKAKAVISGEAEEKDLFTPDESTTETEDEEEPDSNRRLFINKSEPTDETEEDNNFEDTGMSERDIRNLSRDDMKKLGIDDDEDTLNEATKIDNESGRAIQYDLFDYDENGELAKTAKKLDTAAKDYIDKKNAFNNDATVVDIRRKKQDIELRYDELSHKLNNIISKIRKENPNNQDDWDEIIVNHDKYSDKYPELKKTLDEITDLLISQRRMDVRDNDNYDYVNDLRKKYVDSYDNLNRAFTANARANNKISRSVLATDNKKVKKEDILDKLLKKEGLIESKDFKLTDNDDLKSAKDMLDTKEDNDTIEKIVDVSAESKEDLKKSYIGSVILRCPTCRTMIYKNPEDLVKAEGDEEVYNVDEECPHCGAKDGYEIVGQVASLDTDTEAVPEAPMSDEPKEEPKLEPEEETHDEPSLETPTEDDIELDASEEPAENVHESLDSNGRQEYCVMKDGDNIECFDDEAKAIDFAKEEDADKVLLVKYGPKDKNGDEPELSAETIWAREEVNESLKTKELNEEILMESLDENSFDKLVRRYMNETYSNIKNYRTTNASIDDANNTMILEGKITFKSGKEKDTKFTFEAKELTKKGKIKFSGVNEMFSDKKSFTLLANIKNNKLLSESLSYSYKINESKVSGKICLAKKRK